MNSKVFVSVMLLFLLITTIFSSFNYSFSPWNQYWKLSYYRSTAERLVHGCNLFSGNWIPDSTGPSYTNASNCMIDDRQNCMKLGRPNMEFLKWRWKPNKCELPMFNATLFLEIVRGKSMAFIGDSLARNQMQSLTCLLSTVDDPWDVTNDPDGSFRLWHFRKYNFKVGLFWSVHLVKSEDADTSIYPSTAQTLHLDKADEIWASRIHTFDYVITSAGQWFLRPLVYYENGDLVGCSGCENDSVKPLDMYYGYKMAFRTLFRTLLDSDRFNGTVVLRTFSPQHYENGDWNTGGECPRTGPIGMSEMRVPDYFLRLRWTQVDEFEAAEKVGLKKGLKFWIIDPTEMMGMRPDGHPNHHGLGTGINLTAADCVHWCLPGPIDMWNAILLQMIK